MPRCFKVIGRSIKLLESRALCTKTRLPPMVDFNFYQFVFHTNFADKHITDLNSIFCTTRNVDHNYCVK